VIGARGEAIEKIRDGAGAKSEQVLDEAEAEAAAPRHSWRLGA
jgi:hypothetical protein